MSTLLELPSRIPPHDLDAEHAVLGCLLIEGAAALPKVAALLDAGDFYTDAHRSIYAAMLGLADVGQPISVLSLQDILRRHAVNGLTGGDYLQLVGGPSKLASLVEAGAVETYVEHYATIIRRKAVLRGLITSSVDAIGRAFDDVGDAQVLLDEVQRTVAGLAERAAPAARGKLFPVRSLAELLAAEIPQPEFHIEGWIPTKGFSFLVGDSEAFKSWWAKYLGLCKAAGIPVLGQINVRQGPVLYISEENGEVEDKRRASLLCRGMGIPGDVPFYIASETSFNFDDPARYAALRAEVAERGVTWIIVDSFVRVHRREEKDAGAMNAIYMDRVKPLIRDGIDLLLLHHKRKIPAGMHQSNAPVSDNDEIRGSGDLRAAAHAVMFLKTLTDSTVVVKHNKGRGFRKQDPFVFSLRDTDTGGVELKHEGKPKDALDKTDACKAAILEYAAEHAVGFFRQDVIGALKGKFSKKVVDPALTLLSKDSYPLKADEIQQGRTKKKFYVLIVDAPDREPGDEGDVPF